VSPFFLEEIFKGAPSVFRASGPGRRGSLDYQGQRKEGALVANSLVGDTRRDGLSAFEPVAGIEVGALPAGMQLRPAVGTLAERIDGRRQARTAVRAA
jgi:hypothetical protein